MKEHEHNTICVSAFVPIDKELSVHCHTIVKEEAAAKGERMHDACASKSLTKIIKIETDASAVFSSSLLYIIASILGYDLLTPSLYIAYTHPSILHYILRSSCLLPTLCIN